ncbi:MAG: helix-turn-helix domain-containing protein [Candidatus Omnitrophota bacterium]
MNNQEVAKLIKSKESGLVEFKETFDREAVETIGAFANTKGGIVVIGVSDKGKIKGISIGKATLSDWTNQISQSTEPRVIPEIEQVKIEGKEIAIIRIKEYPIKPISVKGKCFRRVGNSNRTMTAQEISEMHLHSIGSSWDAFPARGKTVNDIDLKKVARYIKEANANGRRKIEDEPKDVLQKLEFVKDKKASWAAILVFGKEPQRPLSQSAVHCGRFKIDKTQILDDLMIESDLISQVDEVIKFITRHISVRYEFEGKPKRKEIWEYPLEALREAVINAIVHRDYSISSNVQVEIYDDRIEIWNPGGLLPGITVEDLYKKEHKSVTRNKLIAQVFYDIGYIEKYGSGTIKIIDLCKQNGLPSPEFKEVFGGFSVIFRKDIYTEKYLHSLNFNERQIKAVMFVKEKGKITNREYKELAKTSKPTATRDLVGLVQKKIFIIKGQGKRTLFYMLYESKESQ